MLPRIALALSIAFALTQAAEAQTPPLVHVANNAALQSTASSYGIVVRDGYGTAGDGGRAIYRYASSACSLNGGTGDGGSQVPASGGGCWLIDPAMYVGGVSVKVWGAKDDDTTDAQPAFTQGWTALAVAGGGRLVVPATTSCFLLASPVRVAAAHIEIYGEPGNCVDRGFPTDNLIQLGVQATPYLDLKVTNLSFKSKVTATSGSQVAFFNAPFGRADGIKCQVGAYYCISIDANGPYFIRDLYHSADGQAAVAVGCLTGLQPADIHIDGADVAYQHRAAFEFCTAGGVTMSHVNTDINSRAIWAHPGAGQNVSAIYTTTSYFDVSTLEGILMDGSQGRVSEWVLDDSTWIASCGVPVPAGFSGNLVSPMPYNPNADCLYVTGQYAADNVLKPHVLHAARNGIILNAGTHDNVLGGVSMRNCDLTSDAACAGLRVSAGASNWSWAGRAGGDPGDGTPNNQRYGVYIGSGGSDYYTVSGDLSGNTTATLFDGGTGLHKSFAGMIPGVPWATYPATVASTGGSLAAASTSNSSYTVSGSTVTFTATATVTTNGSGSGSLAVSLPITPTANGLASARNQSSGILLSGIINSGQANVYIQLIDSKYPVVNNGESYIVTGSYQAVVP